MDKSEDLTWEQIIEKWWKGYKLRTDKESEPEEPPLKKVKKNSINTNS